MLFVFILFYLCNAVCTVRATSTMMTTTTSVYVVPPSCLLPFSPFRVYNTSFLIQLILAGCVFSDYCSQCSSSYCIAVQHSFIFICFPFVCVVFGFFFRLSSGAFPIRCYPNSYPIILQKEETGEERRRREEKGMIMV